MSTFQKILSKHVLTGEGAMTKYLQEQPWKNYKRTRSPLRTTGFWNPNLFAIWLRSSVVSVLFSVTAETSSLMTLHVTTIFGFPVAGLDGHAHTWPHSVATIAPSVSDATFVLVFLCGVIE